MLWLENYIPFIFLGVQVTADLLQIAPYVKWANAQ